MFFLLFLSFFVVVGAGPVPAPAPSPLPSPVPEPLFGFNPIAPIADGIKGELAKLASSIASTSPTATPATIPEAVSMLKAVFGPKPTGLITSGIALARNGLQTSGTQGTTINSPGAPGTINSFNNTNPAPPTPVFPKAGASDPAFDRTEKELRSAIFIPANFPGAGAANPVLLVPGTGNASIGQAAWVNVPGAMLDDVQTNAEFIAYAVNYLAAVTGKKVSVVGWSQGNLAAQWALQYWPSVRAATRQLASFSPDFRGTVVAAVTDFPLIDSIPLGPSLLQQKTGSNLLRTLQAAGGTRPTSRPPPSTAPPSTRSCSRRRARRLRLSCSTPGVWGSATTRFRWSVPTPLPAISAPTRASCSTGWPRRWSSMPWSTGGPADPRRMDLKTICQNLAHPALDVKDVAKTEATIPIAAVNILEFPGGVTDEPAIRAYARVQGKGSPRKYPYYKYGGDGK
ncbi:hypothetical protein PG988_013772 [Apiospora saccharicola]